MVSASSPVGEGSGVSWGWAIRCSFGQASARMASFYIAEPRNRHLVLCQGLFER